MKPFPGLSDVKRFLQDFRRDVIRMMRVKFIAMAMSILIAVFVVMLASINVIMNKVSRSQSMRLLRQIADSDRYASAEEIQPPGRMPDMQPAAMAEETDHSAAPAMMALAGDRGDRQDPNARPPVRPEDWGGQWGREDSQAENSSDEPEYDDGRWEWENDQAENSEDDPEDRDDWKPPEWEQPPMQPTETAPSLTTDVPVNTAAVNPSPPAASVPSDTRGSMPPETAAETTTVTTAPLPPQEPPTPKEPPRSDRWNVSITIDHFAILADAQGNLIGVRNTEDYTDEEAVDILEGILARKDDEGMYGWLQYCRAEKNYGTLLVITDKTSDQGLLNNLFRTTVIIGIVMLLVLLGLLIVLSRWITKPVQNAFTRQKQFVSDAGHELKTPIAVLTANADILQDEIGENKWLGYMQEQISRMSQLVGDLLRLARMDNAAQEYEFTDFDLSMAVAATTLPFESAAFEQQRNLEMDVPPGIIYHGSEQHIRQLCAIFIDNAIKYSNENGIIKVTLMKKGEHSILEFYNTGCEIAPEETERIFERFYRGDKARNNKGKSGYGLGLAIAKSIMDVHRIRFSVTCEQGRWIRFLLTL